MKYFSGIKIRKLIFGRLKREFRKNWGTKHLLIPKNYYMFKKKNSLFSYYFTIFFNYKILVVYNDIKWAFDAVTEKNKF